MASETEHTSLIPKLPLSFSVPPMPSPERSGSVTPPLQTMASVPFRWEDEPGKPRPCTDLVPFASSVLPPKSLDLPPRLLFEANLTKLLSPTSVLDGPCACSDSFRSPPSFRISGGGGEERGSLGALVLNRGGGGWFGSLSWRKKKKKQVEITKMKRSGSFSSLPQAKSSCVWATISGSLKQVVPWRSKKQKKNSGNGEWT